VHPAPSTADQSIETAPARPGHVVAAVADGAEKTDLPGRKPRPLARALATVSPYFWLTKPRVVELLLVTTVPAMILAADGWPGLGLTVAVVVGGAMAAGSANAVNSWIERDRDKLMHRTESRPLPTGAVQPTVALVFAITLQVVAFTLLSIAANLLCALLTLSAALFYVFVYTIWLKPRTVQNIVIGGAAGAVPVLAGWAAVTGSLDAAAWVMFAVIFFWTPPHFWALAIKYRDDYARGGFPMMPVVKGIRRTTTEMLVYTVIVVATTLTLWPVADTGVIYGAAASVLGAAFIVVAFRLRRRPEAGQAIKMFVFSNLYLALLFCAITVDTFV
jgi:heme o synthase